MLCKFPSQIRNQKKIIPTTIFIFPGMTIVLASVHFLQTGERASHTRQTPAESERTKRSWAEVVDQPPYAQHRGQAKTA